MDILDIMRKRHSVRQYEEKKIEEDKRAILNNFVDEINKENHLNIQICYDEPTAFNTFMAHYGKFNGVSNYIALVAKKGMDEVLGYQGERLVLKAQEIGLNTCWVALTYGKGKVKINKENDEKLYCVISLGYGKNQGAVHKTKSIDKVLEIIGEKPEYLDRGVKACLMAPTAINQQKFKIICNNGIVTIKKNGLGFYTDMDLGIIKCHFELATNTKVN